jgi:toxin FitB
MRLRGTRSPGLPTARGYFDGEAAARYGSLVALTLAAGRSPKPRRMDLMIAAIASSRSLPLYTRNGADFIGVESLVDIVEV